MYHVEKTMKMCPNSSRTRCHVDYVLWPRRSIVRFVRLKVTMSARVAEGLCVGTSETQAVSHLGVVE